MNIPIIYEDDWFLVLDKPTGLLVIPAYDNRGRNLTDILNDEAKSRAFPYRLHPCHRLDRETSGLIIFAKGKSSQKKMMELFHQKKIKKTYLACVNTFLAKEEGEISSPINGESALTRYKQISKKKGFSILEIEPLTGRTNQIRLHLRKINHPILGDRRFAVGKDFEVKAQRLCLHAQKLEFIHPLTKKALVLVSPVPKDLSKFFQDGK